MEQGSYLVPNKLALHRTNGQFLFKATGATSYDDLGSIEMAKLDYGMESEKAQFALTSGAIGLADNSNIAVSPIYTINGKQFTDQIEAMLALGTLAADDVQSSASASTANITAKLGKTFDLGKRNITFTSLTVAAAAKIRDVDFFVEEQGGLVRFPFVAAGVADAAAAVVTFDVIALTRKYIANAGTVLNFYGSALYLEYDALNTQKVRAEHNLASVILSPKSPGDGDPKKNKQWEMQLAIVGGWTKKFRVS